MSEWYGVTCPSCKKDVLYRDEDLPTSSILLEENRRMRKALERIKELSTDEEIKLLVASGLNGYET